jgi:uncharacterized protein
MLPITLTIAGAAALLNLWLGARISQIRLARKVSVGDGGDPRLQARMRAHANFVEYVPMFLILLALVEYTRGSESWLWGVAILFVLGRIAHMFGMERPAPNKLRAGGILVTWLLTLGLALYAIAVPYLVRAEASSIVRADASVEGTKLS